MEHRLHPGPHARSIRALRPGRIDRSVNRCARSIDHVQADLALRQRGIMTNDSDFDPIEDALKRCQWCLVVPTDCPDDPNIIGPFTTFEEARIWLRAYPDAIVRIMASPEFEALCRAESEEIEAWRRPRN